FQQRPSMGWGSYEEVRHKKKAIDAFFGVGTHSQPPGLLQISPDYSQWEPGAAAQEVQRSAHPGRYAEQWAAAETLWERHAHDVEPYRDRLAPQAQQAHPGRDPGADRPRRTPTP